MVNTQTYIQTHAHALIYLYIYIYIERERERAREGLYTIISYTMHTYII